MKNSEINKLFVCTFEENDRRYKLEVDYGFHKIGDQEPYFSITCSVYEWRYSSWKLVSCGCQHDIIAEYAPHLLPLIKWHLCSIISGPMHYVANGMFWLQRAAMKSLVPLYYGDNCAFGAAAMNNFKETIVYGASPSYDRIEESVLKYYEDDSVQRDFIRVWLDERLPEVMESFYEDMRRYGIKV